MATARTKLESALQHKASHMRVQARTLEALANDASKEERWGLSRKLRAGSVACKAMENTIRDYLKSVTPGVAR